MKISKRNWLYRYASFTESYIENSCALMRGLVQTTVVAFFVIPMCLVAIVAQIGAPFFWYFSNNKQLSEFGAAGTILDLILLIIVLIVYLSSSKTLNMLFETIKNKTCVKLEITE